MKISMKRKEFEDNSEDFSINSVSFPSRKSRRLDGEFTPFMQEDPRAGILEAMQGDLDFTNNGNVMETNASATDAMHLVDNWDEKAIVLYQHPDAPFLKSPSSPEFSIILNSDLIPGLKDYLLRPGDLKISKLMENEASRNKTRKGNDCLAVVPWNASQHHVGIPTDGSQMVFLEPMEAEETEAEMMDTDENTSNPWKAFELDGIIGSDGLQHWQ
uniref:Uncharacterized protein n=1 Tax=Rhizophora mucronata TaxID=61149 RepID=A0A2P2J3Q4_RHIMU